MFEDIWKLRGIAGFCLAGHADRRQSDPLARQQRDKGGVAFFRWFRACTRAVPDVAAWSLVLVSAAVATAVRALAERPHRDGALVCRYVASFGRINR